MLDPATGTLQLDKPPLEISPTLTRAAFLASKAKRKAKVLVKNGKYCSWQLEADIGGTRFAVSLYFRGQTLFELELCDLAKKFGDGWDDWSLAREKARKAAHDAWLVKQLGKRRRFDWGEVESSFDPRSGSSGIVFSYAP